MNKKRSSLVAVLMIILSLTACSSKQTVTTNNQTYTLTDVKQHNLKTDCWTVINNQVYDLSAYIASGQHKPVIEDGCGIDATKIYQDVNKHSGGKAQNLLSGMLIGKLIN